MGVYPDSGLPAVVEIAPGANLGADPGTWPWDDVTGAWRLRDGLTITEGRGDWGETVDAGSIALVFGNSSGDFSQYNPAGKWFGRLGRDTPLRVRLRRGNDAFGRALAGSWGAADSGQSWTNAGGADATYDVAPGGARHVLTDVGVSRISLLGVDLVDVTVETTVTVPALAAGAPIIAGLVARWNTSANNYICELLVTPAGTVQLALHRTVDGVFATMKAATTVPGLAHTAGKTYGLEWRVVDDQLQARVWDAAGAKPSVWHVEVTDSALPGPGQVGARSRLQAGNTNALPVPLSYGSFAVLVDLAGGYVPAWVPRWDQAGKDRIVAVTARGALYRLQPGTGTAPKRSPMRRTFTASAKAYWPIEDGDAATLAGSAIPGHPPLTVTGGALSFAEISNLVTGDSSGFGTSRLGNLAGGASLAADVPVEVTAATATGWSAAVLAQLYDATSITGDVVLIEVDTPGGTFTRWRLIVTTALSDFGMKVVAYNDAGAATVLTSTGGVVVSVADFNFSVWQNGPNIEVGMRWAGGTIWEDTATVAGQLTGVTRVGVNTLRATSPLALPLGHLALWSEHPMPVVRFEADGFDEPPGGTIGPVGSWRLEAATERLARLCAEDGMPLAIPAIDGGSAIRMDLQPTEAPLALYRECEAVDGGVLFERPFGLAYQPRSRRYNQTPTLILNAAGDLAEPPQPDPDGQTYRNRFTVTRNSGSSAIAQTDGVATGVELAYDESLDINVAYDRVLPDRAGWQLHLSARTDLRWPQLDIDLAARPDLIDSWLNTRIGSRIQATNPPADVAGQDIDVILEGHTTTLGYKDWTVAATCSPAAPWDVATAGGPQRAPAWGSTLAASLPAGATVVQLASTAANGPWTESLHAMPLDIRVGGERVTAGVIHPAALDRFDRISAGWGTATTGQPWTTTGGSASDYSVAGE